MTEVNLITYMLMVASVVSMGIIYMLYCRQLKITEAVKDLKKSVKRLNDYARMPTPIKYYAGWRNGSAITIDRVTQKDNTYRWIVRNGSPADSVNWCLDIYGNWIEEPRPSERTADFIANTRFQSLEEAWDFLSGYLPRIQRRNALDSVAALSQECDDYNEDYGNTTRN